MEIAVSSDIPNARNGDTVRYVLAVVIGLLGAILIWTAAPYNNFVLGNSYITDSYLPIASLFTGLLLVLIVNPLLRRFSPRLALNVPHLAVAYGILLIASVLPGQGILSILIGISLCNFPGKKRLERNMVSLPKVMDGINWLRRKSGKPPLQDPAQLP